MKNIKLEVEDMDVGDFLEEIMSKLNSGEINLTDSIYYENKNGDDVEIERIKKVHKLLNTVLLGE